MGISVPQRLHDEIHDQADQLNLQQTQFIDWVEYEELGQAMINADLVLGIFGDSDKSKRVIPNKLYQALAMGKAVLTADTPAIRELLTDDVNAFLCEAEPDNIASRIFEIKAETKKLSGN